MRSIQDPEASKLRPWRLYVGGYRALKGPADIAFPFGKSQIIRKRDGPTCLCRRPCFSLLYHRENLSTISMRERVLIPFLQCRRMRGRRLGTRSNLGSHCTTIPDILVVPRRIPAFRGHDPDLCPSAGLRQIGSCPRNCEDLACSVFAVPCGDSLLVAAEGCAK